jgi:hypothetical protein
MSRAIVTAAVLLSTLWLIPASPIAPAVASPTAAPATVTVHFPPGKVFGRIWLQRPRPKDGVFVDVEENGTLVKGDLKLEKGSQYRLQFKYDGSEDVSFVDHLGPFIRDVNTAEFPITDQQAAHLAKCLPNLANFQANRSDITDQGVKCLLPLKKLVTVSLSRTELTGKSLTTFGQMPQLEALMITHNQLSDASMSNLSKLHNLKRLRLNYTGISDAALVYLEPLTDLMQVQLSGNAHITDLGVAHLRHLKKLTEVQLAETAVTYHCVDTLKQLPKLKRVWFSFRKIGDQGVAIIKKTLDPSVKVIDSASTMPLEMFAPLHSPIAPQNSNPLQ